MKKLFYPLLMTSLAFGSTTLSAAEKPAKPRMEVCFVLDTTGSMSGLIEGAKQKIWSIANEMVSAKPAPELRLGLVGYRDRGDDYVVKSFELTNDIDAVYANLRGFAAGGGGDTPESVNEALNEAVTRMSWSADRSILKIIFLVGDAPPHMDYANAPKYPDICQAAVKKDLIINTVQCGTLGETTPIWKEIAKLSEGNYVAIAQEGGMVAIDTPMDAELARLNREIGGTLVAYGSARTRGIVTAKQAASEAAPAAVVADRLSFNTKSGKAVQGDGELLDTLASGTLKLADVKREELPVEWQKFDAAELKAEVAKKQQERDALQEKIVKLNQQRDEYIASERKKLAAAAKTDGFDEQVAATIRSQAAKKGLTYGK
ncbi:MAG: VWA domain-containing protein [Verrucomicrobiota bacterium]